jgi:hypothetical protein
MTIRYNPTDLLKKIAPAKKLKRLVTQSLTLNKAVLSMFDDIEFISKSKLKTTALKTIRQYKDRFKEERKDGLTVAEATQETLADKALMVSRVQNAVVSQVADDIQDEYSGEFYIWLPSDADTPDPQHQLNYGKKFQIGKGEFPGERFGCRCSAEILVKETKLQL